MDQKAVKLESPGEVTSSPLAPVIGDPTPSAPESDPDPDFVLPPYSPSSPSSTSSAAGEPVANAPGLPGSWKKILPLDMQDLVRKTIRKGRQDKAGPDSTPMWLCPPDPPSCQPQPPSPAPYFACPLFLWLPYRLWRPALQCPQPECAQQGYRMSGAGLYKTLKVVLAMEGWYLIGTEYLECSHCGRKRAAWDKKLVAQLDVCHQLMFPAVLTYKRACDRMVITLHNEAGGSVAELHRYLAKRHRMAWMQRCLKYLVACGTTTTTTTTTATSTASSISGPGPSSSTNHPDVPAPPPMEPLPSVAWLRAVLNGQEDQLVHLPGAINKLSQRLLKRKLIPEEEEESSVAAGGSNPTH